MPQDLFDELGIDPGQGAAAPVNQASGGDLFDELGIDPYPDQAAGGVTPQDYGYQGEMRADDPGFLEGLANDLIRGWQRGRQGVAVMHNEFKDGGDSIDNQVALSTRLADLERKAQAHNASQEQQDALAGISQAPSFGEAASQAIQNPRAVASVVLESLGMYAPAFGAIEAAGLAAGPVGTAGAAGLASASIEYSQSMIDSMRQHGYNPTDPNSWRKALSDPQVMSAAREHAVKRGVAVGAFDAMTGGLAGKLIAGAKPGIASPVSRAGGELALQAGGGAAGESAAQAWSGDKYQPGEILMEAAAEIPTAVVEAPANVKHARAAEQRFIDALNGIAENFAFDQLNDEELDTAIDRGETLVKSRSYKNDSNLKSILDVLKEERKSRESESATPSATGAQQPQPTSEDPGPVPDSMNAEDVLGADPGAQQAAQQPAQPAQPVPNVDLPTASQEGADNSILDIVGPDGQVDLSKLREYHQQILDQYDQMTPEQQRRATGVLRQIDELYRQSQRQPGPGPAGGNVAGVAGVAGVAVAPEQKQDSGELLDLEKIAAAGPVEEVAAAPVQAPVSQPTVPEEETKAPVTSYVDPRLKRQDFREWLDITAKRDMVPGGGITLIPRDGAVPTSNTGDMLYDYGTENVIRTQSLNPKWVQTLLSEEGVSVKYVRRAVEKAIAGEKLGVKQARVVKAMLDEYQGQREEPANIEFARQKREKSRAALNLRRMARAAKPVTAEEFAKLGGPDYYQDEDQAGNVYEEDAYDPSWGGEARALSELARQADGIDAEKTERILSRNLTDAESARLLWKIIENGQQAQPAEETRAGPQQPEGAGAPAQGQEERVQAAAPEEVERYQWTANKEGGQSRGNRQEIRPLTEALFNEHIKPKLRNGYADTLDEYLGKHPGNTHINLVTKSDGKVILGDQATGSLESLRPKHGISKGWAIKVDSFDSPEAKAQRKTADSDLESKSKGVPVLDLSQQTQADLDAKKASDEQRQADEKAAEQKAQADQERDSFVLAGSNAAVDQAEARGQKNLFDQGAGRNGPTNPPEISRKSASDETASKSEAVPKTDLLKPEATGGDQVIPFPYVSGMSRPADFDAVLKSSAGIGVEAMELSSPMIDKIVDAADSGKQIFIDSGAFRVFKAQARGKQSRNISFEDVLARYKEIQDKLLAQTNDLVHLTNLMFVMPDVVGDQKATINLIRRHKKEIMDLGWHSEIVIPFQGGPIDQAEAYREIREILGDTAFIIGIPSNAAALSDEDFTKLIEGANEPDQIHILGAVQSKRFQRRMETIRHVYKDNVPGVTADANALRAKLDSVIGKTAAERALIVKDLAESLVPGAHKDVKRKTGSTGQIDQSKPDQESTPKPAAEKKGGVIVEAETGADNALADIQVTIQAEDENGNTVEITRKADVALADADSRLEALKKLWRCLH